MTDIFEFSTLSLPLPENKLTGPRVRKLMADLAALMFGQRLEVFNDEGGRSKWAPLNPRYAAWKLRKFGGKSSKILSLTNLLRSSFTPEAGPGSRYKDVKITDLESVITTHAPYAAIQNFGGRVQIPENRNGFGRGITIPAHSVTIPARPFDEFRDQDTDEIAEHVDHYLNG